jgi:hypothetical protein
MRFETFIFQNICAVSEVSSTSPATSAQSSSQDTTIVSAYKSKVTLIAPPQSTQVYAIIFIKRDSIAALSAPTTSASAKSSSETYSIVATSSSPVFSEPTLSAVASSIVEFLKLSSFATVVPIAFGTTAASKGQAADTASVPASKTSTPVVVTAVASV